MSFRIPTGSGHKPFMNAWQALFTVPCQSDTNFDIRFEKSYGVKIIRTKTWGGVDSLELEFPDEGKYVLFMMEWE